VLGLRLSRLRRRCYAPRVRRWLPLCVAWIALPVHAQDAPPEPPAPETDSPDADSAEPPASETDSPDTDSPETDVAAPPDTETAESDTDAPPDAESSDAAQPEGEGSDVPPPPGSDVDRPRIIVIDAAAYEGIQPVVAQHVTQRIRMTAEELGYEVVSPDDTVQAAQRLRMPYPPAPADLWRVTYVAEAKRGAFARVWAHQGQYVTEISIASLDGTGPFFARGTSGADDLHEVVARLTREALPAPSTWDQAGYERATAGATQPQQTEPAPNSSPQVQPSTRTPGAGIVIRRRPRTDRRPRRRWDLALQTEGAIGTSSDGFYNHLVGLRLGFRITKSIHLGLYGGYANLRGKDGRVSNLLGYLQIEDRIRLTSRSDITVPLRFAIGYLPFNGPFVRLSAGVNIPLTQRVELAFDVLVPTFWVLPERTAVSLNLGAELIFRL